MSKKDSHFNVKWTVLKQLWKGYYKIELETWQKVKAKKSWTLKNNQIKIIKNDEVVLRLSTYDPTKGQIIERSD